TPGQAGGGGPGGPPDDGRNSSPPTSRPRAAPTTIKTQNPIVPSQSPPLKKAGRHSRATAAPAASPTPVARLTPQSPPPPEPDRSPFPMFTPPRPKQFHRQAGSGAASIPTARAISQARHHVSACVLPRASMRFSPLVTSTHQTGAWGGPTAYSPR